MKNSIKPLKRSKLARNSALPIAKLKKKWSHKLFKTEGFKPIQNNTASELKLGSKNPMWKGEGVGKSALHYWVRRRLIKPNLCEMCGERKATDLANKGIYDRNFENWNYLCRRCHMNEDGRINNLKQYAENKIK